MKSCKFKKKNIKSKLSFPVRLRGGANHADYSMIEKAIANARAHNINVHTDSRTPGDGNCIFESVLKNINSRESFLEVYDGTADHWRNVWMTEVEGRAYANWNCGLSEEEWLEEFHRLKSSRIYECMLGDLILLLRTVYRKIYLFSTHLPWHIVRFT